VKVDWELFNGRYEPKSIQVITIRPEVTGPVNGTTMRSLKIGQIVDMMRVDQHKLVERIGREVEVPPAHLEAWEKGEKPRLGEDHYRRVAEVYKAAFAAGASPTKVVAETFHVSASTAGSWVSRARNKYGFLGETPMGQKGI
jgi:hypothetical protein